MRLEILEREGKFIKRSEALEFLKAFMRTVYRVVEQMNLAEEDRLTPRASFAMLRRPTRSIAAGHWSQNSP